MFELFLESAWKVVVAGIVLGAGLPVLFAVGVRSTVLAGERWQPAGQEHPTSAIPPSAHRLIAVVSFGLVIVAVALGISIIIAAGLGKEVSFDNVFPTFVPKD